jgi:hypothetical protein
LIEWHQARKPIRINQVHSDWSTTLYNFHSAFRRNCNWDSGVSRDSLNWEHSANLKYLRSKLELATNLTRFVSCSNLSTDEWRAARWLEYLVRHKQIALIKADKGRQWVVANFLDYVKAVKRFIETSGNYIKVPFNSKYKTAARIKQVVNRFVDLLDRRTKKCLLAHIDKPRSRKFYGLPKIHKPRTN